MRDALQRLTARVAPSGQVIRFGLVGLFGFAVNFLIYHFSMSAGIHYLVASFFGWFISLVGVFLLNRTITFAPSGRLIDDFARTVAVYLGQQLIVAATLFVAVDLFNFDPRVAFLLALPPAVAVSFFGMKFYALRERVDVDGSASDF